MDAHCYFVLLCFIAYVAVVVFTATLNKRKEEAFYKTVFNTNVVVFIGSWFTFFVFFDPESAPSFYEGTGLAAFLLLSICIIIELMPRRN